MKQKNNSPSYVNCLPFLGHEKWEAVFMLGDLRIRYGADVRREAARLFDKGFGYGPVAGELGIPAETVRTWLYTYGSLGLEGLLAMGKEQARYAFGQKVSAARAVVEDGMPVRDAMAAFRIASRASLNRWCRLFREGGEEALRAKPRGRPRGSKAEPGGLTREQELAVRVRKLEAENAYLKKLAALRAEETCRTGSRPRW